MAIFVLYRTGYRGIAGRAAAYALTLRAAAVGSLDFWDNVTPAGFQTEYRIQNTVYYK
jgi:hypothetical protein